MIHHVLLNKLELKYKFIRNIFSPNRKIVISRHYQLISVGALSEAQGNSGQPCRADSPRPCSGCLTDLAPGYRVTGLRPGLVNKRDSGLAPLSTISLRPPLPIFSGQRKGKASVLSMKCSRGFKRQSDLHGAHAKERVSQGPGDQNSSEYNSE